MQPLLISTVVLLGALAGCDGGAATQSYKNLPEAESAGAIDKGWIPDFLPRSATNIKETHQVDPDETRVEFSFAPEDVSFIDSFALVEQPRAKSILNDARFGSWSQIDPQSATVQVYSIERPQMTGFLVVDRNLLRAQYWERAK